MQSSCTNDRQEYAGFWVRLFAYLIDMVVLCIPLLILNLTVSGMLSVFEGTFLTKGILFQYTLTDIIMYLAKVLYFILCTYMTGTTVGKKLLNLRVVYEEDKKLELIDVVFRETVGKFLSGILNFGYICIGLDRDKRGFHDFICDTRVVYSKKVKVYQSYTNPTPKEELNLTEGLISKENEFIEPETKIPQTYSFVPEQVTNKAEEELWHIPQRRTEELKEEDKVTYSWHQFEFVDDSENKKED